MRPYTSRERILIESSQRAGESSVLLRLLASKFSTIPKSYQNKIQKADSDSLHRWAERLITSESLEEIFEV